jgi:hypothetical protein
MLQFSCLIETTESQTNSGLGGMGQGVFQSAFFGNSHHPLSTVPAAR